MDDDKMPDYTLGQKRVQLTFNPNQNHDVERIKRYTAELIDEMDQVLRTVQDPEIKRLAATAMTAYEEAAMWAVKAVTG